MNRIISALSFIPSDDRETWLRLGMAVKSETGDAGFDAWDSWSQSTDSYKEDSARAVWRSIKPVGKVTVATLFFEARANGWHDDEENPSQADVEARKQAQRARAAEFDAQDRAGHERAAK